jgi:formylglycine-generating enzyme required for sulfatase activity
MSYVPAGPFVMGDDDSDRSDEKPAHEVHLDAYYIGRYPVTNADYKRYKDDVRQPFEIPEGKRDHPVVEVFWYDARDYAAWAGMRLLTEAEWEKAASAPPKLGSSSLRSELQAAKRKYPWGDVFDAEKCNTEESGIGTTTPVGKYSPQGDGPYGCADMAGNVQEWTSSLHQDYPYRAEDGREDMSSDGYRVVRGGSFGLTADNARCAYRDIGSPHYRVGYRGLRVGVGVVAAPFSPLPEA